MDELGNLLKVYFDMTGGYMTKVVSSGAIGDDEAKQLTLALITKINQLLDEQVTIKRVLTYTGNKVDIEKGLAIRAVQGSRDVKTYTITEEFIDV